MTRDPAFTTDVFDYLMGDGFVMVGARPIAKPVDEDRKAVNISGEVVIASSQREVWTGIEGDVERLERLLR